MGCTIGFGQGAFFVAAGRANQLVTQRFGPLASNQAHTTGGGVEQNQVTGLQTALGQGALEQILHCQALEHHGRTGIKVDVVGQFADIFGRHHTRFAIASWRRTGIGSAVAGLQMRHASAHGLDHPRSLHAQAMRHL